MIRLLIRQKTYEKTDLQNIERYDFTNLFDLVWILFEHNHLFISTTSVANHPELSAQTEKLKHYRDSYRKGNFQIMPASK